MKSLKILLKRLLRIVAVYALIAWGYVVARIIYNGVAFNGPFLDGWPDMLTMAICLFIISGLAAFLSEMLRS